MLLSLLRTMGWRTENILIHNSLLRAPERGRQLSHAYLTNSNNGKPCSAFVTVCLLAYWGAHTRGRRHWDRATDR